MEVVWDEGDFRRIQQWVGYRPGEYAIDPYYIRRGFGNKCYFWEDDSKKWRLLHNGDKIIKEGDSPSLVKEKAA